MRQVSRHGEVCVRARERERVRERESERQREGRQNERQNERGTKSETEREGGTEKCKSEQHSDGLQHGLQGDARATHERDRQQLKNGLRPNLLLLCLALLSHTRIESTHVGVLSVHERNKRADIRGQTLRVPPFPGVRRMQV